MDMNLLGKSVIFTVENQNMISSFMGKVGFNKKFNYANLISHLEKENKLINLVDHLKSSNRPTEVKVIRLLNKIQQSNDVNLISSVQK